MSHQAIRTRIEPAFIEPMQSKPVTAPPPGRELDLRDQFDGYRCIAVKRGREVTLFSRHKKVLNKRFPGVVDAFASLDGDFVLDGELVAIDSQGRPSFQILQNNLSRTLPVYFYAFDLLNRDGELLVDLPIERRRILLGSMLSAPEDALRLRLGCRRLQARSLRRCASSVWKVSSGNKSVPPTNPASDRARGSGTAPIWNKNSSLAVTSPVRMASMHCSWAFTKTNSSSSWRR